MVARINFEDDVESRPEFRKLLPLCNNEWDAALGKLVRFFRIAQNHYIKEIPIAEIYLSEHGLEMMIASGWAVPFEGGFRALGDSNQFAWYTQKLAGARSGGKKRASGPRDSKGRLLPAVVQPDSSLRLDQAGQLSSRNPATSSAPTLALAPSPALSKNKEYIYMPSDLKKEQIQELVDVWGKTLAKYGITKNPVMDVNTIGRLIQAHGIEKTKAALAGAGCENKSESYNPASHCRITRLLKPDIFEKFVNLGSQERQQTWLEKKMKEAESQ